MQPCAIIVGLDSLPGIHAARALARHGVPVIAIARRPHHYCCRTRVCHKILFADTQTKEFIASLIALGPTLQHKAVLFPCTDMSVLLISQHRQQLADWYHVSLPEPDVVEMLMDKIRFHAFTQKAGFRAPRTMIIRTHADVEHAIRTLIFPCILKPALRTAAWTTHSPNKVFRVHTAQEFRALYTHCSRWTSSLILQEWIEGPDANLYSCNCYFDADAKPVATYVARKLRQWPPGAGISCLGQECRNDAVLRESLRLFQDVHHVGLGYVEIKRDDRTGEHFILEANIGRPTVRSGIVEAGGVEMLYAMYCDNIGWPLPEQLEQGYRGVKWIHLHYDLRSALHYWRRGELTLKEWWRSWRGQKTYAVFSRTDPGPFLGDLQSTLLRGAKRLIRPDVAESDRLFHELQPEDKEH
jgi:D-aspartate ligase